MSKLTMPIEAVKTGGLLKDLYYDLALVRSDIVKSTNDTEAIAEGLFNMSIQDVGSILAEGGETYGYLMAIQAPIALLEIDVPFGLPKNVYFDSAAKPFRAWFSYGAEVWIKDDNSEIIFYTNPFAGNESLYLKGSEIKVIHDIQTVNALTIEEAEIETASGWTKL